MTVALVSGAGRGLGAEIARQLEQRGLEVIRGVRRPDLADPSQRRLDITDPATVDELAGSLDRLDVLVNNAGILDDADAPATDVDLDLVRRMLETNLFGAWRLTQACLPLLRRSGRGRIVNMSTGMSSLADGGGGYAGYRLSKTALNSMTVILSHDLRRDRILVNCMNPGWVRTDMGGSSAPRPISEGADTAVWLATLPDDGPTGGFFKDRALQPW